jgi:RND superfamily putative drug exporter
LADTLEGVRGAASWCSSHRRVVIFAWIAALAATAAIHAAVGSSYADNFTLKGTESARANTLLARDAPQSSGDTDQLVMEVSHGLVIDPAAAARMDALLRELSRLPHVSRVLSPYATSGQISRDGKVAFATVNFDLGAAHFPGAEAAAYDQMISAASSGGVSFAADGQVAEDGNPGGSSDGIAIGSLAAGVVLFLVFGSLLATALPLLTAALSLGTGLSLVGILSHVMGMASFSGELALLIGMGVGVDYALFIVTRYRQGRLRGLAHDEAVIESIDTCGRAVLFAGMIVCIAMLGMFLLGVGFLYGVAVAAAITVAFTVLSALTLLPALLSLFGDRTLRRSERRAIAAGELRSSDQSAAWARWAAWLNRRPALLAAVATGLMLLLAVPFLSMRLGSADYSSDATSTTTYRAYEMLARGFGAGYNGPLELVATVTSPAQRAQFTAVTRAVAATRGVDHIDLPAFLPGHQGHPGVALDTVYESQSPQSASTASLLSALRHQVIPFATQHDSLQVLVSGQTAVFTDFAAVLTAKLPLFIGIVVFVSALLLTAVFRSFLIPLTAALMNLLSTAASLGVVTAVFQFGWFGSLLGLRQGPIEAFLPVLMFPILFGLSMDYEVFLVSRIHEEWHRCGSTREAVAHGLASTGRTITAAAAIMVLVFAAFVLGGQRIIDLFGIGLASAVLLDALIVRAILVPAAMLMLGEANWKLPGWLERRLPHFNIEGASCRRPLPGAAES